MYCPSCGKEIPEKSTFCLNCGKAIATIATSTQAITEWEYKYYSWDWELNNGGKYPLTQSRTEPLIRLQNWAEDQSKILPNLQQYLDIGWQPVSEVGPSAYVFRRYNNYLSVAAFRVKLRKPRTSPIPPYQSSFIGKWQVGKVETKALIFKAALGLGLQSGLMPKEYNFATDNNFWLEKRNKSSISGIYSFPNEKTFNVILDPPAIDILKHEFEWNGNELIIHEIGVPLSVHLHKIS